MRMVDKFQRGVRREAGVVAILLGCCLSLSALASTASAAPLSPSSPLYSSGASIVDENPFVRAEYKGTITTTLVAPPVPESVEQRTRTATMSWQESVAGPVDEIEYTGVYGSRSIHWKLEKLEGKVVDNGIGPSGETLSCTGTFSPVRSDVGEGGIFVPAESPGHPASGGNPQTNAEYTVRPPGGLPAGLLLSAASGNISTCEGDFYDGTGPSTWGYVQALGPNEPAWSDTVDPTVSFPVGGSHTQPLNFEYTCAPPACGSESQYRGGVTTKYGTVSVKLESSITFSSPGFSSGSPTTHKHQPSRAREGKPPGPVTCPSGSKPTCGDKKLAQEHLKGLLPNLANQCAIAGLGSGLIVAGLAAPESGVAAVLAAAGPTGAEIFALSGPACAILNKQANDVANIIDDPPIGHLRELAWPAAAAAAAPQLAPCTPYTGPIASFCESLRGDATRYLSTLRAGQALDAALVLTVDRITGAAHAHNRSALRLQTRHAAVLRSRLKSAAAGQKGAGRAIAAVIGSQGLGMSLTAAQQQGGVNGALSGLRRRGISASKLAHLTGVRLAGSPGDVLAGL
ncbi:MAG: hypothetical protein ACYDHN_11180 [Solirubrobacteraceae bacterium]